MNEHHKRDIIAQWAFDTRSIIDRFHLELIDIKTVLGNKETSDQLFDSISFMDGRMERLMTMTTAVTALGTKLFGRFGEGKNLNKASLNQVKKDADAISAYTMSESLWFASRHLPENHAIMVLLGEGLMPKGGETPEMGSNPQLGFGRIYAREHIAQWLEIRVVNLLNDPDYHFEDFYKEIKDSRIIVWGAAIDTLENTTRFAKGEETGPMTVLHLFDQPLGISRPYEGYMGNLILPREVVDTAANNSVLLDFRAPRKLVMEAIKKTYPGIRSEDVHIWTLGGHQRGERLSALWDQWKEAGAHLIDGAFVLPSGMTAFTDSGTYGPSYQVRSWQDADDRTHVFLCDGYAATAESMQAATLAQVRNLDASMSIFSPIFELPYQREQQIMCEDPDALDFADRISKLVGRKLSGRRLKHYRDMIDEAREAGFPIGRRITRAADFFPEKHWQTAALVGYMCADPYTGARGVTQIGPNTFETTVHLATPDGDKTTTFTLRLTDPVDEVALAFSPLLMRFVYGEDFKNRAVKSFDSGRIRNELQTLCSEALEYTGQHGIRVHFDRIPNEVISPDNQKTLLEILRWYKEHHPILFRWLEIVI